METPQMMTAQLSDCLLYTSGKKEDLWQITLYKSRYDSYKTGEFRLQCGLWGYFHEGEPLMISLENLIFKKFEVSGKLDFRL